MVSAAREDRWSTRTLKVTADDPGKEIKNYYVELSRGNDTNRGDSFVVRKGGHGPWKTLSKAAASGILGAHGTVVHIVGRGGNMRTITSPASDIISKSGASDSRRWRWQCEGCKLIGTGDNNGWSGWKWGGTYVDVVGFDVTSLSTGQNDVYMFDAQGNHMRFLNNYLHDTRTLCLLRGGGAAIGSGPVGSHDIEISGNIIRNLNDNPGSNSDNICHGLYVRSDHVKIYNNIIYDVHRGRCMTVSPADGSQAQGFISISNNLCYRNGDSGGGGILTYTSHHGVLPAYTTIANNIIYDNGGYLGIKVSECAHTFVENNLLYGNRFNSITTSGCRLSSAANLNNIINKEPRFRNLPEHDFYPTAGSPAVDHGTVNGTLCVQGGDLPCVPLTDRDGTQRPHGSAFDIGPYELH